MLYPRKRKMFIMGLHMCGYFMSIICKISRIAEVAAEFRENVKNSHYKELAGDIVFQNFRLFGFIILPVPFPGYIHNYSKGKRECSSKY